MADSHCQSQGSDLLGIFGGLSGRHGGHPARLFQQNPAQRQDLGSVCLTGIPAQWHGETLLETALDWGKQMGVRIAKLGVTAGNQEALGLYTALGFQVYGNEPQALFVNGQAYDELLLAKGI